DGRGGRSVLVGGVWSVGRRGGVRGWWPWGVGGRAGGVGWRAGGLGRRAGAAGRSGRRLLVADVLGLLGADVLGLLLALPRGLGPVLLSRRGRGRAGGAAGGGRRGALPEVLHAAAVHLRGAALLPEHVRARPGRGGELLDPQLGGEGGHLHPLELGIHSSQ